MKKVLVTTAWPYANAPIHEGHVPGNLLPGDIFARYQRLLGNDVLMVSGTDAHGTPNIIAAEKEGVTTSEFVDKVHKIDLSYYEKLQLSYDYYTKTSNPSHKEEFIKLFQEMYSAGFVIKQKVKYFYSGIKKKALLDRYIEGTCPHCNFEKARGDQCDNCGKALTPFELINPYSIYGDEKLEIKESEDLFIDLAKLQPQIEEWFNSKNIWKNHVANFTKAWLSEGLQARSITRDINWGIEVPENVDLPNKENKRFYVWVEAVAGYLTASINISKILKGEAKPYSDDYLVAHDHDSLDWQDWWLDSNAEHYYFMGKDNIPFHTIIWPAMLLAANSVRNDGEKYNLPTNVPANCFMNLESKKISKSGKWWIGMNHLLSNYDVNLIRYYFALRMPENKDSDFKWKDFIDTNNNELVANIGNFIHRVMIFNSKNFDDTVKIDKIDSEVEKQIKLAFKASRSSLELIKFGESLNYINSLTHFGNKYFNDSKVWEVIKSDKEKAKEIIANCVAIILALRTLYFPFMPKLSDDLSALLGLGGIQTKVGTDQWNYEFVMKSLGEVKLNMDPKPLVAKIDEEVVGIEEEKLGK